MKLNWAKKASNVHGCELLSKALWVIVFICSSICFCYFMISSTLLMKSLNILQLLEYIGRGKSIIDVGLAQARHPLTTRYHYFEILIVDPGQSCFIAIGLARRVSTQSANSLSVVCLAFLCLLSWTLMLDENLETRFVVHAIENRC